MGRYGEKNPKLRRCCSKSLKEDKDGGDDEVEEMAEEVIEPSTNPKSIKTTEVVEFEELKAENERLKTELASAPASAPLDTNKFSSDLTN